MFSAVAFTLASALVASAVEFNVTVGANNQLVYSPNTLTAQAGDIIHFFFLNKNHTVTQSTFADPCTPMAGGADSGFMPVATGTTTLPVFNMQVENSSTPLWFHCAQTNPVSHCEAGMVFAVNPTADKTFNAFQANAMSSAGGSNSSTTPSGSAVPSDSGSLAPSSSDSGSAGASPSSTSTDTDTGANAATTSVTDTSSPTSSSAAGGSSPSPSAAAAAALSPTGALSVASLLAAVAGFLL